jgi:hypothetical protein
MRMICRTLKSSRLSLNDAATIGCRIDTDLAPTSGAIARSGEARSDGTALEARSRAMTRIFAERSAEKRSEGEALIREADKLHR